MSDDEEEDTRISKRPKVEGIREWTDNGKEVEVINLLSDEESSEEEEGKEDYPKEERNCEDSAKEDSPRMSQNPRKQKIEEDPDDKDHDMKKRKELESWDDLEELMRARVVRENCRRGDEGPSNQFSEVWQEV